MSNMYSFEGVMDLRDPVTFGSVYDAHRRGVHAAAFRVLNSAVAADDVVQDVFLRVWRDPDRFDPRRGELGSYLRLVARSRAVDVWREREARGRAEDRLKALLVRDVARPEVEPLHVVLASADRAAIRAALRGLPGPQREALVLAYWCGMTTDQIAVRVGVPLGTAKGRIRLGLARLRAELAGGEPRPVPAAA
jgi:RNA polymerase sigma-70 factor (ECF subfamily)